MADAFRERLLNVLSALQPPLPPPAQNLAVPLKTLPVDLASSSVPRGNVSTFPPFLRQQRQQPRISWELMILATLLASLGVGLAVATLIWKKRDRARS